MIDLPVSEEREILTHLMIIVGGLIPMKFIGMALLLVSVASLAFAGTANVPEISPASGVAALTLVSGAILVIRGRRKR
jgi:hypothetical protein